MAERYERVSPVHGGRREGKGNAEEFAGKPERQKEKRYERQVRTSIRRRSR